MQYANTWYGLLLIIAIRYFLLAGLAYMVWYKWMRHQLFYKKIQQRFPTNKDIKREIGYSTVTILIFTLVPVLMLQTPIRQYTLFYENLHTYPVWWFWLAFPIMFFVHDTYFYWMHRLMHHPGLFKQLHVVHHLSTNPTPWAAFAFQPSEAFIEAGIFIVLVMIMPLHLIHLFVFFLFMMLYNVYGHLGWELYPKNFSRNIVGRWINTSFNHNQHHQYFKGNYGLYFLFWDRWMGTIRSDYEEKYEANAMQKKAL